MYVPEYNQVIEFITTCSKVDKVSFDLAVQGNNTEDLEDLLEKIDHLYSYGRLHLGNRRFTNLEWTGNSIVEIDPEIWEARNNYECMLEKDIV
jgi:hypothetical protein